MYRDKDRSRAACYDDRLAIGLEAQCKSTRLGDRPRPMYANNNKAVRIRAVFIICTAMLGQVHTHCGHAQTARPNICQVITAQADQVKLPFARLVNDSALCPVFGSIQTLDSIKH